MGLSVWRETSKKLTVYRVCYTPIETLFCNVHQKCSPEMPFTETKRLQNEYWLFPSTLQQEKIIGQRGSLPVIPLGLFLLTVWLFSRSDVILAISFSKEIAKIAKIASDRENNHTVSKNTPCK